MLVQKNHFQPLKKILKNNLNINLKDSNEKTATSSCMMSDKEKVSYSNSHISYINKS